MMQLRSNDPLVVEHATQIAWYFLEQSGLIREPWSCRKFLVNEIELLNSNGVSSRLSLSNKAIAAYLRSVQKQVGAES